MVHQIVPFAKKSPKKLIAHSSTNDIYSDIDTIGNNKKIYYYVKKNASKMELISSEICYGGDRKWVMNEVKALNKNIEEFCESKNLHCAKSVRMRSYSGPHFPIFELMRTRITPNTDTFHAMLALIRHSDVNKNCLAKKKLHLHEKGISTLAISFKKFPLNEWQRNFDLGLGSDKITANHNLTNKRQSMSQNVSKNFDSDLIKIKVLRVENDSNPIVAYLYIILPGEKLNHLR